MLWHFRLGHPSFHYMKYLFPILFENKKSSSFQCDICQFAKNHRATFSPKPYTATNKKSLSFQKKKDHHYGCQIR